MVRRNSRCWSRILGWVVRAVIVIAACSVPHTLSAAENNQPPVDGTQTIWAQLESSKPIQTWLLCGVFPNPPHEGTSIYDHTPPCVGFDTDYLVSVGGEEQILPTAGMVVQRPDGTDATWFESTAVTGTVDMQTAFTPQPTMNVVAYAYTRVHADSGGKAILALGSDDGIKVWVNSQVVHENLIARGVSRDQDMVPVMFKQGDNFLLMKIEQGSGGWGFVARLLGQAEFEALEAQKILRERLLAFQNSEVRPKGRWDYMFTPDQFPEIVWKQPGTVEKSVGSVPLSVRWFNSDLEELEKPDKPGRYLAYIEGETESGMPVRRALTLYCRPPQWQPWNDSIKAYADYPPKSPINKDAWKERRDVIAARLGSQFVEWLETTDRGAILMSYLSEMEPLGREPLPTETPEIAHDDLHLALKRDLFVEGKYRWLELPFERETPAPVLRKGTAQEAGVQPDAAAKIRTVCNEWYEASQEPFAILVARHGVIIIHEAFGPISVDTPLYMASITKAIAGMMFAQFLDQDLIGLDDPVGNFLPDFPVEGEKMITLRHCFTHTTGLDGHGEWGGMHNPWLDNVILNGIEYLTPGKIHHYNGMGYDLAGKVMEMVSGKSIFRLMHENFFDPLGVSDTTIDDLAFATLSSAEDIARMGQLLLNRGSYGDRQFFSEETFEQLLPKPLSQYYPELDVEWGVGLTWMRTPHPDAGKEGLPDDATLLSRNTIGHGAASSAILRVDLDNGIVVSQTRNTAGEKYQEYYLRFMQAIDESIVTE